MIKLQQSAKFLSEERKLGEVWFPTLPTSTFYNAFCRWPLHLWSDNDKNHLGENKKIFTNTALVKVNKRREVKHSPQQVLNINSMSEQYRCRFQWQNKILSNWQRLAQSFSFLVLCTFIKITFKDWRVWSFKR
ncbi:MAG: hypothetical protein K9J37_08575 [Saprospiraceae bacterium]|nr:hypothetical protein [Saprospiraceae bacterium]MCF8249954.1 hypothetical protein [Saprospiraceae bacterium]MCF8279367.1 hypothetical protein [Bacteroidales bacterium]MCF8310058.1 hypothetical protein [Saprospiraceae bacterium]MCF8438958.1 hypothetical protein [Saprospiraceae bacterium]